MALTKQVTLKSVTDAGNQFRGKVLRVVYELVITDNGGGFTKEYSAQYKDVEGLTVAQQVERVVNEIAPLMQGDIDKYKREQQLLNHPQAQASAATIDGLLEL
ncbi:MAG: hypothetical protein ACYS6W_01630 [Planctomycetota bacterium]|jgi:hypothetical protein